MLNRLSFAEGFSTASVKNVGASVRVEMYII